MRKTILLLGQQGPADIIDFLTMHPDARQQVVRVLVEMDAAKEGP